MVPAVQAKSTEDLSVRGKQTMIGLGWMRVIARMRQQERTERLTVVRSVRYCEMPWGP
jgi:hypothetical protein